MAPAVVIPPSLSLNAPEVKFDACVTVSIQKEDISESPVFRQAARSSSTRPDEAVTPFATEEDKTDNHLGAENDSCDGKQVDWVRQIMRELSYRPREERRYLEALETRADSSTLRTFTLISGPNGSGRAILARSIKPVVDQMGGHLITGKFEKHTQPTPYGAYVMAINEYIRLVIRRGGSELESFAQGIKEYAGANVAVLLRWIPALGEILSHSPQLEAAAVNAGSVDRFAFALKSVRRAMDKAGRPIFLLLEDIHYADTSSLEMLASLLRRPHEVSPGDSFVETILVLPIFR